MKNIREEVNYKIKSFNALKKTFYTNVGVPPFLKEMERAYEEIQEIRDYVGIEQYFGIFNFMETTYKKIIYSESVMRNRINNRYKSEKKLERMINQFMFDWDNKNKCDELENTYNTYHQYNLFEKSDKYEHNKSFMEGPFKANYNQKFAGTKR